MTDPEFTYALARKMFITRDKKSIDHFNYDTNRGIEAQIRFIGDRLEDICGVVMCLLDHLESERTKND